MTIDLRALYTRVGEILDGAGNAHTGYSVDIEWWNHRRAASDEAPVVRVFVAWESTRQRFFEGASADECLMQLRAFLVCNGLPAAEVPAAVDVTA